MWFFRRRAASAGRTPAPASGADAACAPTETASAGADSTEGVRSHRRGLELLRLAATIVGALLVVVLLESFVAKPFNIPSASMEPTLNPGDLVIVNRLASHFRDGEIVVFYAPVTADAEQCGVSGQGNNTPSMCSLTAPQRSSTFFIKRIEGVPGDRLSLQNGRLYRNGRLVSEPYTLPCTVNCNFPKTIVVPPGHYFMMGDNRSDSDDSRFWGAIPSSWIVGEAAVVVWPLSRLRFL